MSRGSFIMKEYWLNKEFCIGFTHKMPDGTYRIFNGRRRAISGRYRLARLAKEALVKRARRIIDDQK